MIAVRLHDDEWPSDELVGAEAFVANGRTVYLRLYSPESDGGFVEYVVSPRDQETPCQRST